MKRLFTLSAILGLGMALTPAMAQDADDETQAAAEEAADTAAVGETVDGAKTLSGMSILGNEETPKSLVIVPWKSSEMGDELSRSDTLDDVAQRVDKEVFLRELRFYSLRATVFSGPYRPLPGRYFVKSINVLDAAREVRVNRALGHIPRA